MDILMVCHYGLYCDLSCSFVHGQAKAYAALGHRVRVIIPIALGKKDACGRSFGKAVTMVKKDGVELCYVRYLSLSGYGEKGFNARRAAGAILRHRKRLLNGFSPTFIHAHTLGFDSDVGAVLKKRLGRPLVVTAHGSDTSLPFEAGRFSDLARWCNSADLVVAVSSALQAKLLQCAPTTPVEVILNGFCLHSVPCDVTPVPLSWIQVGHLVHQKRVEVTLDAFARFYQTHPTATLTLVGRGPMEQALKEQAQALGVDAAVTFLGQIPNDRVLCHMAQSQFFVMPSVREGFGIVYLEAMACGCVTVGTRGEGIADLIVDRQNGFLVPPDDPEAIVKVIEDCISQPAMADAVANKGREDAQGLTWQANAERYIRLIEEKLL